MCLLSFQQFINTAIIVHGRLAYRIEGYFRCKAKTLTVS